MKRFKVNDFFKKFKRLRLIGPYTGVLRFFFFFYDLYDFFVYVTWITRQWNKGTENAKEQEERENDERNDILSCRFASRSSRYIKH